MSNNNYGVNLDKPITPVVVRDAVVECFYGAHCKDSEIEMGDDETSHTYCESVVKKAFTDSGGDFENPTKESLQKALGQLAEFSKNFRNPEIIKQHFGEMMELMNKLK
jgi:hypothetical protein